MSYQAAAALQKAVYEKLTTDSALSSLIGGAVYDAVPEGVVAQTYVTLGDETARDKSDASGAGSEHDFDIAVVSSGAGFAPVKAVAGAASAALENADLTLEAGRLVSLHLRGAKAVRLPRDGLRRITLRFRARIEGP